jgi:hypothetical protein
MFLDMVKLIIFFILLYFELQRHLYDRRRYWEKKGVSCPPSNLFFGHILQLKSESGIINFENKNYNKYGKTYG